MPRGGARVGAGRPRKTPAVVVGMDGARFTAPPMPPPSDSPLLEPPADLAKPLQAIWRDLAPLAVQQQTLVAATTAGFRELCEQLHLKRELARALHKHGAASAEADRVLKQYVKVALRVDGTLARFRLTGMGKPEPAAAVRPKAANPWAQVTAGGKA